MITLDTTDGESLQAELYAADAPRAAVVVCHPNPVMGGDMYTPVPAALFNALSGLNCSGVRFNFRGVGTSTGTHDNGNAERLDVVAAMDAVAAAAPGVPLVLTGWSFGADVSLAVDDERIAGWFLAAAPLKVHAPGTMAARHAPAPKRFLVGEVDHLAPPAVIAEGTNGWINTTAVTVPEADHFFGGIMKPVVAAFGDFLDELLTGRSS